MDATLLLLMALAPSAAASAAILAAGYALRRANRALKAVSDAKYAKIRVSLLELAKGLRASLKASAALAERVAAADRRMDEISKAQERLRKQLAALEERYRGLLPEIERGSEFLTAEEEALAKLTPTELKVLRILAEEGPKSASELRVAIGKSREHTARLMKKLWMEGFVKRRGSSAPYSYEIREEVKSALKGLLEGGEEAG